MPRIPPRILIPSRSKRGKLLTSLIRVPTWDLFGNVLKKWEYTSAGGTRRMRDTGRERHSALGGKRGGTAPPSLRKEGGGKPPRTTPTAKIFSAPTRTRASVSPS